MMSPCLPALLFDPAPCNLPKHEVFQKAEEFAREVNFLPGDRIEALVERLGGKLQYLTESQSLEAADGSLRVYGPQCFEISLSAFTGPERDRFTIAHELGHYVLHADRGEKRIRAARFGSSRVEWEANWFAAAFLMPEAEFRIACSKYAGDAALIAARYLVSPAAAKVRMQSLNIAV